MNNYWTEASAAAEIVPEEYPRQVRSSWDWNTALGDTPADKFQSFYMHLAEVISATKEEVCTLRISPTVAAWFELCDYHLTHCIPGTKLNGGGAYQDWKLIVDNTHRVNVVFIENLEQRPVASISIANFVL